MKRVSTGTKWMAAVAVASCGVAIHQAVRARIAEDQAHASDADLGAERSKVVDAKREITLAQERARAADEDLARLLTAIEGAKGTSESVAEFAARMPLHTRADVQKRFEQAQLLATAGRNEDAMQEYLWCYDEGMRGGFDAMGARGRLIEAMAELARRYGPMRAALEERRERAEEAMLSDPKEIDQLMSFGAISKALGESQRVVDALGKLPPGDRRREGLLLNGALDQLVADRRYSDILANLPYERMRRTFEVLKASYALSADQQGRQGRISLVELQAQRIEAVAGTGQVEDARQFAQEVLAFENSDEARSLLNAALARAGHPELEIGPQGM